MHSRGSARPKLHAIYQAASPLLPTGSDRETGPLFRGTKALEPWWKGPYMAILIIPTALKVDGITAWVHYSIARLADPFTLPEEYQGETWEAAQRLSNLLKLKLLSGEMISFYLILLLCPVPPRGSAHLTILTPLGTKPGSSSLKQAKLCLWSLRIPGSLIYM